MEKQNLINYEQVVPSLKMEKKTETVSGNTTTIYTSRVFGGVDCQVNIADMIEEDLIHMLSDSLLKE